MLLAPPEKFEGTAENINSRLEHGEAGKLETAPLMRSTSSDSESDGRDASGSDDTRIDRPGAGESSASGSQFGQDCRSGQDTPVTHRRRDSSLSSGSLDDSLIKGGRPSDLLPTPVNGNIKPTSKRGCTTSFLKCLSQTDSSNGETPKGIKGIPILFRKATTKAMHAISQKISGSSKRIFNALPSPLRRVISRTVQAVRKFLLGVWAFMNPPLWAMLAAIVVASIPDLQRFFFADGTFFKNSVTSAIRQSGGVAVPLILVVLGANLARNTLPLDPNHTKEDDKEETKLLIAALISRMLLPIVIMAPLLAVTAKYVPVSILDDPIFVIVCFLITGAPSALQLAQICQINNVYMGAMSRLLFQSYVVWILPSTLVLVMCALEVVEWAKR